VTRSKLESDAPARPSDDRPRILHRPVPATAPPVVPARMVNEALYCERLLYLEWAQGEFVDNFYTLDGRYVHRRPDRPGGRLPEKPRVGDVSAQEGREQQRDYQARSVWLTSERLGLTAKIDIVDGDADGRVMPVEYKRGKAPDLPEGAYLPERAQVCAQALLLRDHGYLCDAGALYFAQSRRRVPVPITPWLEATTRLAIVRARQVVESDEIPPPLEDSPKCAGCSLNPICLPDEVNLLRRLGGQEIVEVEDDDAGLTGPLDPDPWQLAPTPRELPEQPPEGETGKLRRLQPARDDRVPLYVQDPRSKIRLSAGRLIVSGGEGASEVRLMNTSQVVIMGNAQITTQALRAILERGIPIAFFSGGGYFIGRAAGHESKNVDLRLAQYAAASDPERALAIARSLVRSKIRNCRTLLRRNHRALAVEVLKQLMVLSRKADAAPSLASLLGIEGAAARLYFEHFTGMLKGDRQLVDFDMQGRNRRPPRDPINALLSLCYALLSKQVSQTLAAVGLDPQLGFYHQPRFGRPALALDLMEELRPLVADSVVLQVVNNQVVTASDFVQAAGSCGLGASGRRKVIAAFERRLDQLITHPLFGYQISYRRVIEVQARLLGRLLTGEIEAYPTFGTR